MGAVQAGSCVGVSAHQKLEKLLEVVQLLGYESLCVFGDCFDEIVLLDPQRFPSAIKKFAKEVRFLSMHAPATHGQLFCVGMKVPLSPCGSGLCPSPSEPRFPLGCAILDWRHHYGTIVVPLILAVGNTCWCLCTSVPEFLGLLPW